MTQRLLVTKSVITRAQFGAATNESSGVPPSAHYVIVEVLAVRGVDPRRGLFPLTVITRDVVVGARVVDGRLEKVTLPERSANPTPGIEQRIEAAWDARRGHVLSEQQGVLNRLAASAAIYGVRLAHGFLDREDIGVGGAWRDATIAARNVTQRADGAWQAAATSLEDLSGRAWARSPDGDDGAIVTWTRDTLRYREVRSIRILSFRTASEIEVDVERLPVDS